MIHHRTLTHFFVCIEYLKRLTHIGLVCSISLVVIDLLHCNKLSSLHLSRWENSPSLLRLSSAFALFKSKLTLRELLSVILQWLMYHDLRNLVILS